MSSTHRLTGSLVGAGKETEGRCVGFRSQMFQEHLSDVGVVKMLKTRTNVSVLLLKSAETLDLDILHLSPSP